MVIIRQNCADFLSEKNVAHKKFQKFYFHFLHLGFRYFSFDFALMKHVLAPGMIIEIKERKLSAGGSAKVYKLVWNTIQAMQPFDRDKEMFFAIGVTRALQVKYIDIVAMGTLHTVVVEPREIFRNAILHAVSCIVLAHNHPSGQVKPSPQDIDTTKRLVEAGRLLNIEVVDHLIVSGEGYYSFADEEKL